MTTPPLTRSQLRALIKKTFVGAVDLDAFIGDTFPSVQARFTLGMEREQKLNILLEHADLQQLAEEIQKIVEASVDAGTPPAPERIKILYLAANPTSMPALDVVREARAIEERIGVGKPRDGIELVARWAVRSGDLQRLLLEEKPHILHFAGHGGPREQLLFESDGGQTARVDKDALVDLIGALPGNLRLVVLNACDTVAVAAALVRHVDCAIGMCEPIGDEAAIVFGAAFYQALGFGKSVSTAFQLGKNQLMLLRIPEDQIPKLEVNPKVDAAALALVKPR